MTHPPLSRGFLCNTQETTLAKPKAVPCKAAQLRAQADDLVVTEAKRHARAWRKAQDRFG